MRWTTDKKRKVIEQIKAGKVPDIARSTLWKICENNNIKNPAIKKPLKPWTTTEIFLLKLGFCPQERTKEACRKFCNRHGIKFKGGISE